jgi:PadR family transcriptional regulator PadR
MQLLASGEKYGYELVEALARRSNGVLAMGQSTLYPLLYNLEAKDFVRSRLDDSGARPRRYYRLTPKGERKLVSDAKQWQALWESFRSLGILPQPERGGGRR